VAEEHARKVARAGGQRKTQRVRLESRISSDLRGRRERPSAARSHGLIGHRLANKQVYERAVHARIARARWEDNKMRERAARARIVRERKRGCVRALSLVSGAPSRLKPPANRTPRGRSSRPSPREWMQSATRAWIPPRACWWWCTWSAGLVGWPENEQPPERQRWRSPENVGLASFYGWVMPRGRADPLPSPR